LKNPEKYESVSAFSPICNPTKVPWGEKCFTNYLGSVDAGKEYDATVLLNGYKGKNLHILVDQGLDDNFLEKQLSTDSLIKAATKASTDVQVRMQAGYDHSYFFIASFIEQHISHHAEYLN